MDILGVLSFVKDYADLIIGAALVIAATWVLPAKVRWYVLTAGVAVIAYEGYMRAGKRKELKAAKEEAKRLEARVADLATQRPALEEKVGTLNQQSVEIKARLAAEAEEIAELAKRGTAAQADVARARENFRRHSEENQAALQSLSSKQAQLAILDEGLRALDDMNAAKP